MRTITKIKDCVQVGYSCPSSPNSEKWNCSAMGAYSVSEVSNDGTKLLKVFPCHDQQESMIEAIAYAESTGLPFSKYSIGNNCKEMTTYEKLGIY